jgi:class 3 adenylate cyclase/DNA-binding SARP family transcriptional activator/tetratricopeptide (TPR) repeat protein
MEFRVLGPLEVLEGGRPVPVGGARQRALLAVLLSRPNEVVSTDRLVEELWGENPPQGAEHALQAVVSRLRRALEANGGETDAAPLVTRTPGYLLEVDPEKIDASRFKRLAAEGRRALATDPARASEVLSEAMALWRGPAFAEFIYEPFAQSHIASLEELRLSATEDRIEAELSLGRHTNVVGELEAAVVDHPFRERLRAQLMLALYRSGRQAEALEVYRRGREVLVDELGVDPGPDLQSVEAAILRQDAALLLPTDARPPGPLQAGPRAPEEPSPPPQWGADVRKTVTVVFADVAGSTPLGERLDPEALREVMARYFELARAAFHRHGGAVEKFIGDAVMAVFGIPKLHEDDALRALRAASDIQVGLADLNEELERSWGLRLRVRIGVNTGEIVASEASADQGLVTGDAVNTAARLQEAAEPGEILAGEATHQLVAGAVEAEPPLEINVKGKHAPVVSHRITKVLPGAAPYLRRLDAPLVGRTAELAQLRQGFDRAVRDRTSFLFTILGDPGIGKTRLAQEFASAVQEEAAVLTGRCLPYGEGITYWPLREILHEALGEDVTAAITTLVGKDDRSAIIAERVAAALGLAEAAATVEEINWSVRVVLQTLARGRPLVVLLEDLHWAEDAFLDLVEHLADLTTDAPIFLLCLARGELLDNRPAWGGGKRNATTLELEPLGPEDARTLVSNLGGGHPLQHVGLARVMTTAEGNPLFLEQMTAALAEEPADRLEAAIPSTIQALLAGRLEGLGPGQRAVLECAAVVGKEFDVADLSELLPREARSSQSRHLQDLVRKRFVRPAPSALGEESGYLFRHVLIQQATYRGISKRVRADLHLRLADRLQASGQASEEILGYHLERASRFHHELQPESRAAREVAERASALLASAGRRALARSDHAAAATLLSRATSLLPVGDPIRLELMIDLCTAYRNWGRFADAERALAEVEQARGNRRIELRALIERGWLRATSSPRLSAEEELRSVERAIRILEELGDEEGLCRGWELTGFLQFNLGQVRAAGEAMERAVEHARRVGDRMREMWGLVFLCTYAALGPTPVGEGISLCDHVEDRIRGDPPAEAAVLLERGRMEAMRGNFDEARDAVTEGMSVLEDLGQAWDLAMSSDPAAEVEELGHQLRRAEQRLRVAYDTLLQLGADSFAPTWAARLASVICAQGRDEEALELTLASEELAAADDITAQVPWRATRARIYARQGRAEEAQQLARQAVGMAERTDWLNLHAETLMDLAKVLLTLGKPLEAKEAVSKALKVWEKKGNLVSAQRARALLHELGAST